MRNSLVSAVLPEYPQQPHQKPFGSRSANGFELFASICSSTLLLLMVASVSLLLPLLLGWLLSASYKVFRLAFFIFRLHLSSQPCYPLRYQLQGYTRLR